MKSFALKYSPPVDLRAVCLVRAIADLLLKSYEECKHGVTLICVGNKRVVKRVIVAEDEGLYTKADAPRSNASKRVTCALVYCQSTR